MKDTNFGGNERIEGPCGYCYGFYNCTTKSDEEAGCEWATDWTNAYLNTFSQNAIGLCSK